MRFAIFFLHTFSHLCSFMVVGVWGLGMGFWGWGFELMGFWDYGVGSVGILGLGFSVDGVWGLLGFWGWGSLYKHRRITC